MIEVFPNMKINLGDIIVLWFAQDAGQYKTILSIIQNWFSDEEYSKETYDEYHFEPSPDLKRLDITIIQDDIFDIELKCIIVDRNINSFDLGWGKFTIKNGKIDRFLFEE